MRVDDEPEDVHRLPMVDQDAFELHTSVGRKRGGSKVSYMYSTSTHKKRLTAATFFVVSFPERVMSSSLNSCGFLMSSLFFSSRARLPIFRFFCSMESGPSLSHRHC